MLFDQCAEKLLQPFADESFRAAGYNGHTFSAIIMELGAHQILAHDDAVTFFAVQQFPWPLFASCPFRS